MIVPVSCASNVLVVNENVAGTGVLPATRSDSFIVKERHVTCSTTGSTICGNAPVAVISIKTGEAAEISLEVAATTLHFAAWGSLGFRNVAKITVIITSEGNFLAGESFLIMNTIVKIVNGLESLEDTLHAVAADDSPLGKTWQADVVSSTAGFGKIPDRVIRMPAVPVPWMSLLGVNVTVAGARTFGLVLVSVMARFVIAPVCPTSLPPADTADTKHSKTQIMTAGKQRRRRLTARNTAQARDCAGETCPKGTEAAKQMANTCAVRAVHVALGVGGSDGDDA